MTGRGGDRPGMRSDNGVKAEKRGCRKRNGIPSAKRKVLRLKEQYGNQNVWAPTYRVLVYRGGLGWSSRGSSRRRTGGFCVSSVPILLWWWIRVSLLIGVVVVVGVVGHL